MDIKKLFRGLREGFATMWATHFKVGLHMYPFEHLRECDLLTCAFIMHEQRADSMLRLLEMSGNGEKAESVRRALNGEQYTIDWETGELDFHYWQEDLGEQGQPNAFKVPGQEWSSSYTADFRVKKDVRVSGFSEADLLAMQLKMLKRHLAEHESREDYERCAKIRDEITKMKKEFQDAQMGGHK